MTALPSTPALEFDRPETVLNTLRSRGLRVSTARRVVIDTLFGAGRPVSAEEIAGGLGGRRPPLDLASVYRNLETLEQLGVVRHLHVGHGAGRYALAGSGQREYLACERCGELLEVEAGRLDGARAEVREQFGYEVRFAHFPIVGLCPSCGSGETR